MLTNKKILYGCLFAMLGCHAVTAQNGTTISPATFKQLIGCWQGTLNYSGTIIRKPYTITAELIIKQIAATGKFELLHIYTNDANERSADTLTISSDGSKLNNETITSKRCTSERSLEIVTTSPGFDHDNNKAAIIKQTYTIGKQHYTYKKEVQLEGQTDWLQRQEFTYTRKVCNSNN